MARIDEPAKSDSSPSTSIGRWTGLIHSGALRGATAVCCSAIGVLLSREWPRRDIRDRGRLPPRRAMSSLRGMAGLLLALLAVADPGRALAMLEYVAADYANAVGPGGEVLSEQELREQAIFAREAAGEVRAAGDVALAGEIDELGK